MTDDNPATGRPAPMTVTDASSVRAIAQAAITERLQYWFEDTIVMCEPRGDHVYLAVNSGGNWIPVCAALNRSGHWRAVKDDEYDGYGGAMFVYPRG